jgi:hypothetical protein
MDPSGTVIKLRVLKLGVLAWLAVLYVHGHTWKVP